MVPLSFHQLIRPCCCRRRCRFSAWLLLKRSAFQLHTTLSLLSHPRGRKFLTKPILPSFQEPWDGSLFTSFTRRERGAPWNTGRRWWNMEQMQRENSAQEQEGPLWDPLFGTLPDWCAHATLRADFAALPPLLLLLSIVKTTRAEFLLLDRKKKGKKLSLCVCLLGSGYSTVMG